MTVQVRQAQADDLAELADVAAATFPLACPPSSTPENIAAFIASLAVLPAQTTNCSAG